MSILGMGGGGGADRGSDLGSSFGASFKEFCDHPDNRELMIQHQQKELQQMQSASAKMSAMDFRDKVLEADYEAQKNIAPFLENKMLRRIIKTFTNDPKGDFAKWARNPLVITMLTRAKDMIEQGRVSEAEVEHLIIQSLKQPGSEGSEAFKAKTERKMMLETKDLVNALNEHLELRDMGNRLYGWDVYSIHAACAANLLKRRTILFPSIDSYVQVRQKFEEARRKYDEALSIVTVILGITANDQKEIDVNLVACLMNIGATCIEMMDFGEAVQHLNQAEKIAPNNIDLLMRRARAHACRGDFSDALTDIERVRKLDPEHEDVYPAVARVKAMEKQALAEERAMAKKALQSRE